MRAYKVEEIQPELEEAIQLALAAGESSFCKRYTREDIPDLIQALALGLGIRKEELVKKFDEAIAERRTTAGGKSWKFPGLTAWFMNVSNADVPLIIIGYGQPGARRRDV